MDTYTLPDRTGLPASDDRLWHEVCQGDRDAFSLIVERYQSLVCAVAYAGLGDFAASQDVAQETFVAAWRQRNDLHEPSKLRAWLCGIARTMAANARRRGVRRGGEPESIEQVREPEATGADPLAQVITREEEQLLWRAIEALPPIYREPVVLFYREEQSIVEVARQLELTEDAVKQRLSRGRAMLRAEVAAMIESALSRTRPGATFTAGVLAAIVMTTPATAAAAVTATVATAKGASGAGVSMVAGPAAGLATAWGMSRLLKANARSPREAAIVGRVFAQGVAFAVGMTAILLGVGFGFGWERLAEQPAVLAAGIIVWTGVLLAGLMRLGDRAERAIGVVRKETSTAGASSVHYMSRWRWLGLPLVAYSSSGLDVGGGSHGWAKGWIAIGDRAISPLLAIGGLAIAPVAIGGVTAGFVSASLLGIGVGVLALGSIAVGWWSVGFVAVAWKGAGIVVVAHELIAAPPVLIALAPLVMIASIAIPAGILARRAWLRRRV